MLTPIWGGACPLLRATLRRAPSRSQRSGPAPGTPRNLRNSACAPRVLRALLQPAPRHSRTLRGLLRFTPGPLRAAAMSSTQLRMAPCTPGVIHSPPSALRCSSSTPGTLRALRVAAGTLRPTPRPLPACSASLRPAPGPLRTRSASLRARSAPAPCQLQVNSVFAPRHSRGALLYSMALNELGARSDTLSSAPAAPTPLRGFRIHCSDLWELRVNSGCAPCELQVRSGVRSGALRHAP